MTSEFERIVDNTCKEIQKILVVSTNKNNVQTCCKKYLEMCYEASQSIICLEWFSQALIAYFKTEKPKVSKVADLEPLALGQCDKLTVKDSSLSSLNHIKKLAVVKLNGGLGTSMGCKGPKSLVNVIHEDSFIDIIKEQKQYLESLISQPIPFYLMNSFNTHEQMRHYKKDFRMFLQHKIPRLLEHSLELPKLDGLNKWTPPGHGNIYLCMQEQGILQQLLADDKEFLFISNADNLGATIEPQIITYMEEHKLDFLMEVTPKTAADVKGGALVKRNGRYDLLERAQVHQNDLEHFEDISTFSYFNTNNIWVRISALKNILEENKLQLPIMFNKKIIQKQSIIQCETAMGSALYLFNNAGCLHVDRSRFSS